MTAPIGLQLYTVREALASDLEGTLKHVAEIGFIGVEAWGGIDAIQAKPILDDLGLEVISLHAPPAVGEAAENTLELIETYGLDNVVVPFLPPEKFSNRAGVTEVCGLLNEAHETLSAKGIKLGYHNHEFEFTKIDDTTAYHIMLECLHPDIFIELDTYWADLNGQNVPQLLKNIGRSVPYLHIKDGPGDDRSAPHVAAGTGAMDIPAIIDSHNADWLIVELDACATDMLMAVAESYAYLTGNGLARGKK